MDMRLPPLELKILLESSPLQSRILVRRLAVCRCRMSRFWSLRSEEVAHSTPKHRYLDCTGCLAITTSTITVITTITIIISIITIIIIITIVITTTTTTTTTTTIITITYYVFSPSALSVHPRLTVPRKGNSKRGSKKRLLLSDLKVA